MLSLKSENMIIDSGHCVNIIGIISQPYLNGTIAKIKEYDYRSGKYIVQINQNKFIKIKPENIRVSS